MSELELVAVREENRTELLTVAARMGGPVPPQVAALARKLEGSGEARLLRLTRAECGLIAAAQRLLGS